MSVVPPKLSQRGQRWTLNDIPWQTIDCALMAPQETVFYLVVSASFVETATDTYTRNLVDYYAGDKEVSSWLARRWQQEELQHGMALRRYAETAWPGLRWQQAYDAFFRDFYAKCEADALETSRCLEAVSRCIVEMGTASYYLALSRLSPDPVLTKLAGLIREDEVRHYKYFYRYFRNYRDREHTGRAQILRAILRRLRMLDVDDSSIALKHAYDLRHPGAAYDRQVYRRLQKQLRHDIGPRFPVEMSAKMTLKPLDLHPYAQKSLLAMIGFISHRLFGARQAARGQGL